MNKEIHNVHHDVNDIALLCTKIIHLNDTESELLKTLVSKRDEELRRQKRFECDEELIIKKIKKYSNQTTLEIFENIINDLDFKYMIMCKFFLERGKDMLENQSKA